MLPLLLKYLVTAAVVILVSEIARRTERLGALIGAMPLVAILVMTWLQIETRDAAKVAEYAKYTFWYVLPTLPMFLLIPWLLARGTGCWVSMGAGALLTVGCFVLTALVARGFGVRLIP